LGFHEANNESNRRPIGGVILSCGEKIRGRQVLGENLPPGDSDWGNLTIASQEVNPDLAIVGRSEHSHQLIYGIIAKEHLERDKDG
jgi:hypothetical protein